MSADDLYAVTGKKQHAAQARWFHEQFSIKVVQRADRSVVMTWPTYRALDAKRAGLVPISSAPAIELCYD